MNKANLSSIGVYGGLEGTEVWNHPCRQTTGEATPVRKCGRSSGAELRSEKNVKGGKAKKGRKFRINKVKAAIVLALLVAFPVSQLILAAVRGDCTERSYSALSGGHDLRGSKG